MKKKSLHDLKKGEIKDALTSIRNLFGENILQSIDAKSSFKISNLDENIDIIYVNDSPSFLKLKNNFIPSLKLLISLKKDEIPRRIVIDMGAVPFISKGADVMRPGIKEVDPKIEKDGPVIILDEKHGKPIAVGIAMYSSEEISSMKEGKVIKTLHYVGDKIWQGL
ncbi:MAG: H/ACA RNA-protein complex component Cbf5p [Candidatus Methanofastidiosum methylothiophilum]|uniref:H/ACA RNA-protein complex component Cbf5p n=1 Tax=Candidatus Methanofastidiosum methylothiophilum TaxID=1705564 RepID=A0A150IUZ3_9EURY|nr:MAG: H/ACA RNA-protein complex component Cbf5p [Candidatus Methanofastidiosum methylthiophilus]KYC48793.1 MAG: H/ACA RNA-protein complex component Cbf5p [Candidatus Methanofastidiosum methylthiophilus]KYC51441.1 MAG: H/ACA RNA-protein complex component Cbf5p [Candidatus Methanofastidiosum methylthiophilus]